MALADLNVDTVGTVLVAALDGEIDMSNAGEIGDALSRRVTNDAHGLVVDLTEVTYVDSAAIQIVDKLNDRLKTRGQQIRLVVAPASPIADALRIAGVPAAVGTDETRDAALRALGE